MLTISKIENLPPDAAGELMNEWHDWHRYARALCARHGRPEPRLEWTPVDPADAPTMPAQAEEALEAALYPSAGFWTGITNGALIGAFLWFVVYHGGRLMRWW